MNQTAISISDLNKFTSPEVIHAVLEAIALSKPDPIMLDKFLREIAERVQSSKKAVRQTYEMMLKKLSITPVDLGLEICTKLISNKYGTGVHIKLTKDGFLYTFETTHWRICPDSKIRSQLQDIAVSFKGLTDKSLHSLVSDALGSLKDYLGNNDDVLSLSEKPPSVINCLNGELWINPIAIFIKGCPEIDSAIAPARETRKITIKGRY